MTLRRVALAQKLLVTGSALALLCGLGGIAACAPEPESTDAGEASGRTSPRWNALVLVPDTVRGDHVSANGYERETTPHLDSLAREGINYTRAVTVAPRTWQSFSSILTGLYPPHHGVRFIYDHPIPPDIPSIGSVLSQHGYATAAFDIMPFVRSMTGGRGFDTFLIAMDAGSKSEENRGRTPDERIGQQVAAWISQPRDAPFLAFVRLTGGHWPYNQGSWAHEYDPCDDCSHRFNYGSAGVKRGPGNKGFVLTDPDALRRLIWQPDPDDASRVHRIAHYDSELRAVDAVIGNLLDRLRRDGTLDRTIVVVTSDHGESFGEHGYLQHGPRVDRPVMRVPLILWLPPSHPDHVSGVVRDELVRVIDVMPTLLDALGIPAPPDLDGQSLLPGLRGEAAPATWAYGEAGRSFMGTDPKRSHPGVEGKQRMLRTQDWKLVYTPGPDGGHTEVFDLRSDPAEEHDVSARHPQRTDLLRHHLDELSASEKPRGEERSLSPEEVEHLKALGYMQ